jgi:glutamate synthase domain-containing protein 2
MQNRAPLTTVKLLGDMAALVLVPAEVAAEVAANVVAAVADGVDIAGGDDGTTAVMPRDPLPVHAARPASSAAHIATAQLLRRHMAHPNSQMSEGRVRA